ncbi:related to gEgh 16 protein [Rhynchosporium agropyri]|uniref:Related to gEgh 16 protein n=1 Tax=Rhynchosporium agropyri TaxID=914238 RepID=A0A1E1KS84_9HELO|nr:related to gEgh 16 protein [Rhynchosporium agropyri]
MQYSSFILSAAFAVTSVTSHALITAVTGANNVVMPGLTVNDGVPRDCPSAGCGAQSDTSIMRANEMGTAKASPLGRTKTDGPVMATRMMAIFMDGATNVTARAIDANNNLHKRQLAGLLGGLGGGAGGKTDAGVKTKAGTMETGVAASSGVGASDGLPTTSDSGEITMTMHQCNQDGAGPFNGQIDPTSGGTDNAAFKEAKVTQNVPGIAAGFSAATTTDYAVKVMMPAGMTCSGTVGSAQNVCVVRMANTTPAGPFGGAAAFTQSPAAKKRAIEYNLSKRRMARKLHAKKN